MASPSPKKVRPSGRGGAGGSPYKNTASSSPSSSTAGSGSGMKEPTTGSDVNASFQKSLSNKRGLRKTASALSLSAKFIRGISPKRNEASTVASSHAGPSQTASTSTASSQSTVRASMESDRFRRDPSSSGTLSRAPANTLVFQPIERVYQPPRQNSHDSETTTFASASGPSVSTNKSTPERKSFRNVFNGSSSSSSVDRDPAKRVDKSSLPWSQLTEADFPGVSVQPLPVRLGLVPAFPASRSQGYVRPPAKHRGRKGVKGSRYVDGYYLHLAPASLLRTSSQNEPAGSIMNFTNDSFSDTASIFSQQTSTGFDFGASKLSLSMDDGASIVGRRMSLQGPKSSMHIARVNANASSTTLPGQPAPKKVVPTGRRYASQASNVKAASSSKEVSDYPNLFNAANLLQDDNTDDALGGSLHSVWSRDPMPSPPLKGPAGADGYGQGPSWSEYSFPLAKGGHGRAETTVSQPTSTKDEWYLEDYWRYREVRNGNGGKRQVRYHGFPDSVIPYYLSHDQNALGSELCLHWSMWDTLSRRSSVIPFGAQKPARILDLGTGTGAWCIDVAREWKECEVIGLDMVPCQTPVANLNDPDLERRVSWVVANFLEELPFPSNSFDYVHARFIGAMSIREDQWPDVLAEITRVLKPTGHFELIDRNSNFFGDIRHVPPAELARILTGKGGTSNNGGLPQPARQWEDLVGAFSRTLSRRFLNPNTLSVVGSALLTQDFRDIRTGNPRRMPVNVDPRDVAMLARPIQEGDDDVERGRKTGLPNFSMHVGRPLEGTAFSLRDASLIRAMVILSQAQRNDSCRDIIWDEADEEKRQLMSRSVGPAGDPATRGLAKVQDVERTASWAHPWTSRTEFDRRADKLHEMLWKTADMAWHVRHTLGWEEGNLESVDDRKIAEKQRKLNMGIMKIQASESESSGVGSKDSFFFKGNGNGTSNDSSANGSRKTPNIPPALLEEDDDAVLKSSSGGLNITTTPRIDIEITPSDSPMSPTDVESQANSSGNMEDSYDSADGLTPPLHKTLSGSSSASSSSSAVSDDELPSPTTEGPTSQPLTITLTASSFGEPLVDGQIVSRSNSEDAHVKEKSGHENSISQAPSLNRAPSFFTTPRDRYAELPMRRTHSSNGGGESPNWESTTSLISTSPSNNLSNSLQSTPRGSTSVPLPDLTSPTASMQLQADLMEVKVKADFEGIKPIDQAPAILKKDPTAAATAATSTSTTTATSASPSSPISSASTPQSHLSSTQSSTPISPLTPCHPNPLTHSRSGQEEEQEDPTTTFIRIFGFSETTAFLARGAAMEQPKEQKVSLSSYFGNSKDNGGVAPAAAAAAGGGGVSTNTNGGRMRYRGSFSSLGSLPESMA